MIKKYSKWILVAICAFFISITPSFAREFTLEEFEDYLETEYADATIDSFYLIGEYAFTSNYKLQFQDGMLAARSIELDASDGKIKGEPAFDKMTTLIFDRVYDDDFNPTGIKYSKNLVGTTQPGEKIKVRYIDYVFVPEETKATISSNISAADLQALKDVFGYDTTNSNTDVKLVIEDGKIKLKGFIAKGDADDVKFSSNPADRTGFYYPFNIKVEDGTDESTIEVIGKSVLKKQTNDLTVLFALDPNVEKKEITINVDKDGDAVEYGTKKYVIDYSELVFEKESSATVTLFDEKDEAFAEALASLKSTFNFNGNVGNITLKDGKLEGVVAPIEGIKGYEVDTGYYFAYVLTMPEGMTKEDLKNVKLTIPVNGTPSKVVGIDSFDTDNAIVVIHQLKPDAAAADKKFDVIVDLDGDGVEYTPKTLTISYENLVFAKKTEATVSANIPTADVTDLETVFDFKGNDANVKLEDGKLTGIISKGVANDTKFSDDPAVRTGYYYAFNVVVDGATADTTIEVSGKQVTNYKGAESLSVLFALDPEVENKVITIKVDRDGDGNEYTTETYTIDYSKLAFADQTLENAINNLMERESLKSTLNFTVDAKDAANNASIVFNAAFDGKTNVTKIDASIVDGATTKTVYGWNQEKADGVYNYSSEDNVNWTYTVSPLDSSTSDSASTLLGIEGDVKVVNVAEDGTITFDVLLLKAGEGVEIPDVVSLTEDGTDDSGKEIFTPDKDVHVTVKVKNEQITEMSADLLSSFADDVAKDYNAISFTVTVEDLTESLTIPEDVVKNAVKETEPTA